MKFSVVHRLFSVVAKVCPHGGDRSKVSFVITSPHEWSFPATVTVTAEARRIRSTLLDFASTSFLEDLQKKKNVAAFGVENMPSVWIFDAIA
jgi:hypothetical protein